MPETDLSNIYEEKDVPAEKAAEVQYLKFKKKSKIVDVWDTFSGTEKNYWLRVEGGYKLYGTSGADDRWYFKLGIERPSSMIVDDEIQYFWLNFDAGEDYPDYSGSVSCKI